MSSAAVRGVLVSTTLEGLRDSVNRFIEREMPPEGTSSINPNVSAARDVGLAVQNACVAYDYPGVLQLTVDKVDAVVARQLEELKSMVSDLESKSSARIDSLTSRVQEFIHSLFLRTDWQPKLLGVWPRHVFVVRNEFEISFSGLFKSAAYYQYKDAQLEIRGHIFRPVKSSSTAERLYFNVRLHADWLKDSLKTFQLQKATLRIPYSTGMLRPVLTANYEVFIGTYPLCPGQITLTYFQSAVARIDERICRSPTFILSRPDFDSAELIEKELTISPSPGWRISQIPRIRSQDVTVYIAQDQYAPNWASVKLTLPQGEDKVESYVEFMESQEVLEEKEFTPKVQLKWDDGFGFNASSFKLHFKAFDGTEFECTSPVETNPHLSVIKMIDGSYRLITSNPKQ